MTTSVTSKTDWNPMARHIARVAAKLFATKGYDATSVREIVEGAGVAKPTLYYYFRSKEGLAQALLTVPLSNLSAQLRRIITTETDPIRCLEQILEANFAFCREDPDRSRFIYAIILGPAHAGRAIDLDCCRDDFMQWTQAAVRRLADAGIISRERVDSCTTLCRGLIVISTLDFLYGDKPLGQGLARRLVADLLRGFDERNEIQGAESCL